MSGWRSRNAATTSSSRHVDGALNVPSATLPLRIAVNSPTLPAASSSARRLAAACSAKAWPASVGSTPRPARTNRSAPSARSSLRTCSATAGCDTRSASAAALNEPSSSAAQKQRTCWRDRSSAFDSAKQSTLAWETALADDAGHERTRRGGDRRRASRGWRRRGGCATATCCCWRPRTGWAAGCARTRSGDYWLNYGAHLFPAPGSLVDSMARDCGLETVPVTGSMMGLAVGSKLRQPRARRDLSVPAPAVAARARGVRAGRAEGAARRGPLPADRPPRSRRHAGRRAGARARLRGRPDVRGLPRPAAAGRRRDLRLRGPSRHRGAGRAVGRLRHRPVRARVGGQGHAHRPQPARRHRPAARGAGPRARRPRPHRLPRDRAAPRRRRSARRLSRAGPSARAT